MTSIDTLITSDLAALGEDSRRQLSGLDDALLATNMYRDDRLGAEARRDELVEERRRELVMMPLTLSHVFAHRVGRSAAGAAGLVCSLAMIAMLADPLLLRVAAWLVPGLNLGMLGTLAAIAVLAVYVVATWIAEAWFAKRMRAAIRADGDPYEDLDQLARGPVELAQHAVRRIDGLSLGLFLAGMTALVLVFGYVGVIVSALHELPYAWSITGVLGSGTLERNLDILMVTLTGAGTLAYFVGRACQRDRNSALLRWLGHWSALPIASASGIACMYAGFHMLVRLDMRHSLPSTDARYAIAITGAFAVIVAASWLLLWWRRHEQKRIGD